MKYQVFSEVAYMKQPFRCVKKKLQKVWTPWREHQQMLKWIGEKI